MNFYTIALIVILVCMFIFFIIASFIRWNANRLTRWFAFKKLEIDKPIVDYTRLILDEQGLVDVEVKKVGFFASLFIGNTYKRKTKTIRLSWFVARRTTVTALAKACELIGLARLHNEGAKGLGTVAFNRYFNWLPILFLPIVIVGIIVDLVIGENFGVISIIFAGVGLLFTLIPFIISLISLKLERKALSYGQEIILNMGLLSEEEEKKIKNLFVAWRQLYVVNTILNAFELIYFLLKLITSLIFRRH